MYSESELDRVGIAGLAYQWGRAFARMYVLMLNSSVGLSVRGISTATLLSPSKKAKLSLFNACRFVAVRWERLIFS